MNAHTETGYMTQHTRLGNGSGLFVYQMNRELKRAERYRIFVSLLLVDLKSIKGVSADVLPSAHEIADRIKPHMREIDIVAEVYENRVGVLLPETSRQGAEVAARRVGDVVKAALAELTSGSTEPSVTIEMASYPDAAGARSLEEYLSELTPPSEN